MIWQMSFKAGNESIRAVFDEKEVVVCRWEKFWYTITTKQTYLPQDVSEIGLMQWAMSCDRPIEGFKLEVLER